MPERTQAFPHRLSNSADIAGATGVYMKRMQKPIAKAFFIRRAHGRTCYVLQMKTTFVGVLFFLPLIFGGNLLHAQGVDDRGIRAAASELDHAIDAKNWKRARELLLDEVTVALPGKDPVAMSADALIASWQATLHRGKTSFHQRGSEVATFDGADSAVLRSKGYARFEVIGISGEDSYEFWADYVHELDRHEDGWRVRHIAYVPRLENGNLAVMAHRLPAEVDEGKAPEDEAADSAGSADVEADGSEKAPATTDAPTDESGASEDAESEESTTDTPEAPDDEAAGTVDSAGSGGEAATDGDQEAADGARDEPRPEQEDVAGD